MPSAVYIKKNKKRCHQVCWHHYADTCAHAALLGFIFKPRYLTGNTYHCMYTWAHTWSPSLSQLWNVQSFSPFSCMFAKVCALKTLLYCLWHCRSMLSHVINVSTSLMTPLTSSFALINNGLASLCMHAVSPSHTSSHRSSSRCSGAKCRDVCLSVVARPHGCACLSI